MRGIERVVAAILLAGAVAGAALIPRFLTSSDGTPLRLGAGETRPGAAAAVVHAAPAPLLATPSLALPRFTGFGHLVLVPRVLVPTLRTATKPSAHRVALPQPRRSVTPAPAVPSRPTQSPSPEAATSVPQPAPAPAPTQPAPVAAPVLPTPAPATPVVTSVASLTKPLQQGVTAKPEHGDEGNGNNGNDGGRAKDRKDKHSIVSPLQLAAVSTQGSPQGQGDEQPAAPQTGDSGSQDGQGAAPWPPAVVPQPGGSQGEGDGQGSWVSANQGGFTGQGRGSWQGNGHGEGGGGDGGHGNGGGDRGNGGGNGQGGDG